MAKELKQDKSKTNYSAVLRKFVHPIIDQSDKIAKIKSKYAFGIHVWNATTIKNKDRSLFEKAKAQVAEKKLEIPEPQRLFEEMVKFKEEEFQGYVNVVIDFEIRELSDGGYDLTVASAPLK